MTPKLSPGLKFNRDGVIVRDWAPLVGHKHVQRDAPQPAGVLATVPRPPHVPARLRRLAEKEELTPKESAAWLDDWLTRINTAP